jgi:hypothetical protein
MTIARKLTVVFLFVLIGLGAASCEFGQHRGSHSNAYPDPPPTDQ